MNAKKNDADGAIGNDTIKVVRSALKDAYASVGGYYRQLEGFNRNLFEGSSGIGDFNKLAQFVGQTLMSTLKAANTAARTGVAGGQSSEGSPTSMVLGGDGYDLRITVDPAILRLEDKPHLWPLRSADGKAELTAENLQLIPQGEAMVLYVRSLPGKLPNGTYFGPITKGISETIIGTVFATATRQSASKSSRSSVKKGKANNAGKGQRSTEGAAGR